MKKYEIILKNDPMALNYFNIVNAETHVLLTHIEFQLDSQYDK